MSEEEFMLPALDPLPYRKRIDLVMQTAEQVRKDFDLYDINIELSGTPEKAYSELIEQMVPSIAALMDSSPMLFRELLYRIDVDEHKLGKMLSGIGSDEELPEIYADIIIDREFRKVLTRHLFREKRLF